MQPTHFAHRYFGGVPSTFQRVATNPYSNDVSTMDTVQRMKDIAIAQSTSPIVQQAISHALSDTDSRTSAKVKANAIFHWIKNSVQFIEDEQVLAEIFNVGPDRELLITPERLLTMPVPAGDCDDFSTLAASMLIGMGEGVGVSFCTIAAERAEPNRFSHVYLVCTFPPYSEQVVFDSSHGSYMGWETSEIYRKQEWLVMPMINVRKGLHGIGALGQYSPTGEPMGDFSGGGSVGAGGGLNLTSVLVNGINTGIQATSRILESRYGGVQPGTYQRTPEGGVTYRLPSGGTNVGITTLPDFGAGGSTITWLLIGVAGFGLMLMLTRSRGK